MQQSVPQPSGSDDHISEGGASEVGLGSDLLEGAHAISKYFFGDERHRRKVYHLVSRNGIPTFKMGATLCARKSKILKWIEEQESRSRDRAK